MEEERISESALDVFALVAEQEKDHKMLQNVIFFLQTVLTSFVSSNCHEYTTTCKFFMITGFLLTGSKRNNVMSSLL